jgi:hypothetical protein
MARRPHFFVISATGVEARAHQRRLDAAPPFDVEIVRLTDVQDPVWPLSFWKGSVANTHREWRAPNFIVDPVAGYVNSRIVKCKHPKIAKRNSLLKLNFFIVWDR